MNIFSRLFRGHKPATLEEPRTLEGCINALIEEGRKSTYGWNGEDAAKLETLWRSGRFPKPSVTFNDQGRVFVCPELAEELRKPGNEGLSELLLSMARSARHTQR
jgi:hypothetical protein